MQNSKKWKEMTTRNNIAFVHLLGKTTIPNRLPRECGDPGKRRLHEVVNNIISIGLDPFGELFVYWIPAFARKTVALSALRKV
jgi:hypothetical protein